MNRIKYLIYLLALCFTTPAFATGSSGSGNTSNVCQFGGNSMSTTIANGVPTMVSVSTTNLASWVTLVDGTPSGTVNNYMGFYSMNLSSAGGSQTIYTVPSGKTFFACGFYWASGVGDVVQLGIGSAVGSMTENGSTAPTNPTYFSGTSVPSTSPFVTAVAAPAWNYFAIPISFPQNSVPFWRLQQSSDQSRIMIFGIVQ